MKFQKDGNGALYVEWQQFGSGYKRAWVRKPTPGDDKDWAKTGRYIMWR